MFRFLVTLALCVGFTGCASAGRLPVCDGRHLRPANPNGSVLLSADPPRAMDLSFRACGDRA